MGTTGSSRLVRPIIQLIVLAVLALLAPHGVATAQDVATATPDAEGVIYIVVEPNDSLWAITDRAGIGFQELLQLNGLTEDVIIYPGQLLIVGYGTPPPTATIELPTATVTATRPPPTPTSTPIPPPRTAICLEAFADLDGNGSRGAGEPLKAAVAFTIFNEEAVVGNYVTDGISEPYCIDGLVAGEYKVTRSVRRDESLTTSGDWLLTLTSGSVLNLEFGSQTGVAATPTAVAESVAERNAAAVNPATPSVVANEPANDGQLSTLVAIGFISMLLLVIVGGLVVAARARGSKTRA